MPDNKFHLYIRCIDAQGAAHVDRLNTMTEAGREISSNTFFRHVRLQDASEQLGYDYGPGQRGLHLKKDRCVRFFRSKWQGRRCYYMVWSAIEHVFLQQQDIKELSR